ncbi:Acyl-protein synthetase, LuxE [Cyclobacterium lianum]|uniref:Acyl-protein synthetase, LuxE n=1 Tax=Cyclobacterium lianum TaxID=388280 RepID=A0A1M7PIX8_9BACT|nr:acyl transferase [Cyclobacterium lianum]SHN17172.1 Acyl-protein synthetase, LuxE [Cyclobacterium lianum]
MNYFKSFSEKIKSGKTSDFTALALDLFRFQSRYNGVYRQYLSARNVQPDRIENLADIPFLPISFFKTHKVVSGPENQFGDFYSSSGTTGQQQSRHYIWSKSFYLSHARRLFESTYGSLKDFHVLALLPSYLEREGSSLVDMAAHFIQLSGSAHSGFYLNEHELLIGKINMLRGGRKKVLLLGVTFALLDLAEKISGQADFGDLIVMETGGMKGRRKEMIREEVHNLLKKSFGVGSIHSEYGMTELTSQAYSKGDGRFWENRALKVFIRDAYDPFHMVNGKSGAINVIDLANVHSCAFLETEDLGIKNDDESFSILGRMDNSEIRGCNLMIN